MKSIKNFLWSLLSEHGEISSKRFAGIMCTTFLCVTMLFDSFAVTKHVPSDILIECVTAVAVGALGISAVQTIFKKGGNPDNKDKVGTTEIN